ncbi:hypothetical protein GCM10025854_14280 [Tetragenococcus muriaticus]|nr:hypothetical protein GCM10025854_14280 [Tetragenococcus muriaticus]
MTFESFMLQDFIYQALKKVALHSLLKFKKDLFLSFKKDVMLLANPKQEVGKHILFCSH